MVRFRPGDVVRSRYRAPWVGIVVEVTPRPGAGDLLTVRVILDRRGNPAPKATRRRLKVYDEFWFTLYKG